MIRLIINNSYSQVLGLSTPQFKQLRDILSYKVDQQAVYFSGDPNGGKRYLLGKRGDFPSGLLHLVEKYFRDNNLPISKEDVRVCPKSSSGMFKLNPRLSPYSDQVNAVAALVKAHRGTISMATGTGKSFTQILLVSSLQLKTLIVVPNLNLRQQLRASFLEAFGSLDNITIENIDSPNLQKGGNYDLLICDEAHHSAASTYRDLNRKHWKNIYYRAFFTATPFRSRDEETLLMQAITGEVLYSLDYKKAVAKGYITPVEAYYVEIPKREVEGYTWQQVYSELVVNREDRNQLIAKLLISLNESNISTLCLVKEVKHGTIISDYTQTPFVKGENDDNREKLLEFNLRQHNSLVATTGCFGEGVDSKPCEFVIIAGLGKSKPAFMQQVGRAVRKYPGKESAKVIIFLDRSHKWTIAHFKAQCKVLKEEYGVIPVKLDLK